MVFGLFKSEPFADASLGVLRREGRTWRAALELAPHGRAELRIAGDRKRPDEASLAVARRLRESYVALHATVAKALFAHYEPAWQAWKAGELAGIVETFPDIGSPDAVWDHVRVEYVAIDASGAEFNTEVRLEAAWDEEHTLGARLSGDRFVELCGSVGP